MITIDPNTFEIYIPQSYLSLTTGTIYSMDTNAFRLDVKTLLASEDGMVYPDAIAHNTEYTIAGVTYARSFAILTPYTAKFEDLQYTCILEGSNNNIWDVLGGILVQNQAQVVPTNSAGLVVITAEAGAVAIADAVWNKDIITSPSPGSAGGVLNNTRFLERKVFVDPELIPVGDGTAGSPFNNIGDAIDLAELKSIKTIVVFSEVTLDRNLKNFKIVGVGTPTINCGGNDLKNSEFSHCTMKGTYINSITVQESVLADGFELNGFFENCGLAGDFVCQTGAVTLMKDCANLVQSITVDMNSGGASQINFTGYSGSIVIDNCDNVADVVHIGFLEGLATINASNTLGSIIIGGIGRVVDNAGGSAIDTTGLAENLIWDKDISGYVTDGKAGYELQIARLKAALAASLSA